MKTKPNLNDLKNVNIGTVVAGDALTYNGTNWTNSPSSPADRIIDGTTAMIVDTLGTAEFVVADHQVLSATANQTTFNRPVGASAWVQTRSSRADEVDTVGLPTAVMSFIHQSGQYASPEDPEVGVVTWNAETGALQSHFDVVETTNGGSVYARVNGATVNPISSECYVSFVPTELYAQARIIPITDPERVGFEGSLAITNAGYPYNLEPTPRRSAMYWTASNQLTVVYNAQGDANTDPAPWDAYPTAVVANIQLGTTTVNWSTRLPITMTAAPHITSTGTSIVGYVPLGTWDKHLVRLTPTGVVASTWHIHPSTVDTWADWETVYSVGDITYLGGMTYDNTPGTFGCVVAINHTTGTILWSRAYGVQSWVGDGGDSSIIGIEPHPTDPTQLVILLSHYDTSTTSVVAYVSSSTGIPTVAMTAYATNINSDPVAVQFKSLAASDTAVCLTGESRYDTGVNRAVVLSLNSLDPVVVGSYHTEAITVIADSTGPMTASQVTTVPLPVTITTVTPTYGVSTSVPVETVPNPTALNTTNYLLEVEGHLSVASDIILNGSAGADGEVIVKSLGRPTWGPVSGGGDPTWIINPAKRNVANTHINWTGTDIPLDPYASIYATFQNNIALGAGTLHRHPTGGEDNFYDNVAIGSYALNWIGGSSNRNIAIGTNASKSVNTGSDSICIGTNAGQAGGSADRSIAIGTEAAGSIFSGTQSSYESVAIGYRASAEQGTASGSVGVGAFSMQHGWSESGVAVGHRALINGDDTSITILGTVAIGKDSQSAIPVGEANTAVGARTLSVSQGSSATPYKYNTAIGHSAMQTFYRSPSDNVYNNTAVGYNAMQIASGEANTAIGVGALQGAISQLTAGYAGDYNTALGYHALYDQSGADNLSRFTNCTGVGARTMVDGSNQVQLGDSSTTTYAYGAVQNRSDARDKADIRDTVIGLNFIQQLRPVDFKWDYREDYITSVTAEDGSVTWTRIPPDGTKKRTRYHHGLIAQEVKQVLETTGLDFGGYQDHAVAGGNDVLTLGYEELIAPLIKAVQELATQNQALADRVTALESSIGG